MYNPTTGKWVGAKVNLTSFRLMTRNRLWLYSPWTGEVRDPDEIDFDPLGFSIAEPVNEATPSVHPLDKYLAGS